MRKLAYSSSRSMTWERTAERYMRSLTRARRAHPLKAIATAQRKRIVLPDNPPAPRMQLGHFLSMCDDTGLLQHAVCSVPDRSHGYCIDDNARALLMACALNAPGEQRLPETLTSRLAAFIQHAWNPDLKRFRNFMSFDRRWLEESGSEDCHGRSLWALGECAREGCQRVAPAVGRRRLFAEALPAAEELYLAARLGFYASRIGRLLRRREQGLPRRRVTLFVCRQTDVNLVVGRDQRLGMVRRGSRL